MMPDQPVPGLMVSTIVETVSSHNDEDTSALAVTQAVFDVKNNTQLDEFGATVEPAVSTWLATQGVIQHSDKARVMEGKKIDWAESANAMTVVSGTWVDPRGLALRVATDSLFKGATFNKMAEKLDGPEAKEDYVYTTMSVYPQHEWLVVGFPRVRVSVMVHDEAGNTVLRASAWGKGKKAAFVVNRSPESLQKGFAEAMEKLQAAEVQPLEAK